MKILTFQDFLNHFTLPPIPSLEKFSNLLILKKEGNIPDENFHSYVESCHKKNENDCRYHKKQEILEAFYKIFVLERESTLKEWFKQHIEIKKLDKYTCFNSRSIRGKNDNILDGSKHFSLGRLLKNLHFKDIYSTEKSNGTGVTLYTILKLLFEEFKIFRTLMIPSSVEKILKKDLNTIFAILRGTTHYASLFNPYTISVIFKEELKSKKIFTPTMGWDSYLIGFFNSYAEEYVGVDVIPAVIEKAEEISKYYKQFNSFSDDEKKTKFYCCPSEKLDEKYNFSEKYKNHFDTIFFSPPYYDLEIYSGGEQSIESFSTYKEWLIGYWEETIKLCANVLHDNGKFSFVITDNYTNKSIKETIPIGTDLRKIAEKYFKLEETKYISWTTMSSLHANKHKKGNLEYFYIFSKK